MALCSGVDSLLSGTAVARIKLDNPRAAVVYSARAEHIGRIQKDNRGFRTTMGGEVASKVIYRDRFNMFDRETGEDNLIRNICSLARQKAAPVVGVFEVYVDGNRPVRLSKRVYRARGHRLASRGAVQSPGRDHPRAHADARDVVVPAVVCSGRRTRGGVSPTFWTRRSASRSARRRGMSKASDWPPRRTRPVLRR